MRIIMLEWYDAEAKTWRQQEQLKQLDGKEPEEYFYEFNALIFEMAESRGIDFSRARWRVATYTLEHSFDLNFKGVRHERD